MDAENVTNIEDIENTIFILKILVIVLFIFVVWLLFITANLRNKRNIDKKQIRHISEKCVSLEYRFNKLTKKKEDSQNVAAVKAKPTQAVIVPAKPKEVKSVNLTPAQPKQTARTSTFYLGINSQELFFDTKSQKDDTTKFIAYMLNETEADFDLIDIERIRSIDTGYTVKQKGLVSLKDARSFVTVSRGRIKKSQAEDGETISQQVSPTCSAKRGSAV